MEGLKHISLLIIGLVIFSIAWADVTNDSEQFNATLILSNTPPTIIAVYPGGVSGTYDPVESSTTTITIVFTAEDLNGVSDLNSGSASVTINNSATPLTNSSCTSVNVDSTKINYTCTFTLYYYSNYGNWDINASISDNSAALAYNDSEEFYYSKLAALTLLNTPVDFGTVGLTDIKANLNNPLRINNTGNLALNINITGANLVGVTNNLYNIGVGNVTVDYRGTVNATLSTSPQLVNPGDSTVTKQSIGDLDFWINIPSTGLIPQQYNATWTITGFE